MDFYTRFVTAVILFTSLLLFSSALTVPFYPTRPHVSRFAPQQYSPFKIPVYVQDTDHTTFQRAKRDHRDYDDHDFHDHHDHDHHDHDHRDHRDHHDHRDHRNNDRNRNAHNGGVTGPVHTFVKTDKNANYKWGVRHHVGPKYV